MDKIRPHGATKRRTTVPDHVRDKSIPHPFPAQGTHGHVRDSEAARAEEQAKLEADVKPE